MMNSNDLKVGMEITVNGMKRIISHVIDYRPDRIVVFTNDRCQMTFIPNTEIEKERIYK